jgi:hypothetical protein
MSLDKLSLSPHPIDEELVSVDSLRHVICRLSSSVIVDFHREEDDPPDFTVTINGQRFPAEVTSIVSDQQYHAYCSELGRQVRAHAISHGALSGTYVIRISRKPSLPRRKSQKFRDFCDAAIGYIAATSERTASPETLLSTDVGGKIFMVKISGKGATVGVVWSGAVWRTHQVREQLTPLLQTAVDSKRQKLSKVGIQGKNALLLLYDAYGCAEPNDAIAALEQVSGYDWFHSVFWAASFTDRPNLSAPGEPGREGIFLYSVDPAWHRAGTVPVPSEEPSVASEPACM